MRRNEWLKSKYLTRRQLRAVEKVTSPLAGEYPWASFIFKSFRYPFYGEPIIEAEFTRMSNKIDSTGALRFKRFVIRKIMTKNYKKEVKELRELLDKTYKRWKDRIEMAKPPTYRGEVELPESIKKQFERFFERKNKDRIIYEPRTTK